MFSFDFLSLGLRVIGLDLLTRMTREASNNRALPPLTLKSSVLMNVIPAKVAGVPEVVAVSPPNPSGGGGDPPPPSGGNDGDEPPHQPPPPALSAEQARQILQSIAQDERETRRELQRRNAQARDARAEKDW